MTACDQSVPKLKARIKLTVFVKHAQRVDFDSQSLSATVKASLSQFPEEERSKDVKTLDLNYDDLPVERALGVQGALNQIPSAFALSSRRSY